MIDPKVASVRERFEAFSRSGNFSSDRTIAEYASEIWKVEPCPVI